jgi:hypothetical protein
MNSRASTFCQRKTQTISVAAFSNETAAMRKAVYHKLATNGSNRVPNPEDLRVGDIILTRSRKNSTNPIVNTQRNRGFNLDDAQWTHVSLYVGDLHVLEAQGFKDDGWWSDLTAGAAKLRAGVQIRPVTRYTQSCEIRVLRHTDPDYANVRMSVARYGLLDLCVNRRRYGHMRALHGAFPPDAGWRAKPRLEREVICSELVLECLAIGGQVFVREFDNVSTGNEFFFPASYSAHSALQQVDFSYLNVVGG